MRTRTTDPLLQPFTLKQLTLRNRVVSTSHEPAFAEDGLPRTATGSTTWRRPAAASD